MSWSSARNGPPHLFEGGIQPIGEEFFLEQVLALLYWIVVTGTGLKSLGLLLNQSSIISMGNSLAGFGKGNHIFYQRVDLKHELASFTNFLII